MLAGVKPVVVRDLLRHSWGTTTWDVYTHTDDVDYKKEIDEVYEDNEPMLDINISNIKVEMK